MEITTKNFKLNTEIMCAMFDSNNNPVCYFLYPRSSIIKTDYRLANSVGIIDSGYRGFLIGAFRWLKPENTDTDHYIVSPYTRLMQICLPSLCPIFVVMVDENELTNTTRGEGGFGSSGL